MEITKNYKNMPVVYVAGPFRPKQEGNFWQIHRNIQRAAEVAQEVWAIGGACICPHLNTSPFQGSLPDSIWLDGDLAILGRCDAILMMSTWEESKGAIEERAFATLFAIPIFYNIADLKKWISYYKGDEDETRRDSNDSGWASDRSEKQSLWKSIGRLWENRKALP